MFPLGDLRTFEDREWPRTCTDGEWATYFDRVDEYTSPREHFQSNRVWKDQDIAATIDHTLLKLDAREAEIDTLCQEARQYNFKVGDSGNTTQRTPDTCFRRSACDWNGSDEQ